MESYQPIMNGIIHIVCKIIRNIMVSATEAELGDDKMQYLLELFDGNELSSTTYTNTSQQLDSC